VCERTLKLQLDGIRESAIGYAVFGRSADYNPSEDNIVRVEARHLRKRLGDYFSVEGKDEPYVIHIPKGSYLPVFGPRQKVEPEVEAAPAVEPTAPAAPEAPSVPKTSDRPFFRYAVIAGLVVLAAVCAWLVVENSRLQHTSALRNQPTASRFPWSAVLNQRQTKIVLADSCLVLLEDVLQRQIHLNEYLSRAYLDQIRQVTADPKLQHLLQLIADRQYTSLADVGFVSKMMLLTGGYRDNVALTYARSVNIRDFKADNIILIGAPRANPWVELFEPKMKFEFGMDEVAQRPLFRNKFLQPGEQQTYVTGGANGKSSDSYAVVALAPNLNGTGNVLIIEGTNMEGTEAGVEFLTDVEFANRIHRALNISVSAAKPYFEILLKLRTVGGTSKDVEPVSYRAIE